MEEQRPVYVPDVTAEGGYFYRDLAKQEGLAFAVIRSHVDEEYCDWGD